MNSAGESLTSPRRHALGAALARATRSPRFAIYLACAAAAVVVNYLLGKEMMWDTLDYHLYAGFSALHDRFGQDYFAAGPQSYFNPYLYVPFYLLVKSGLPALVATSILALLQSAILWLTYEMARLLAPPAAAARRTAIGLCAVALALANPILIAELGSSYGDIITAELVLAGWLLLMRAVRSPTLTAILCAGLLLGVASALKLTNAAHALAAFAILPFLPAAGRDRIRFTVVFAFALGLGFLVVATPWAVALEQHFGNPLFPLLNNVFRSPHYTTGSMLDYRFIPDSLSDALRRPFALLSPMGLVDDEFPSPDLRYAVLLILAVLALLRTMWLGLRNARSAGRPSAPTTATAPTAPTAPTTLMAPARMHAGPPTRMLAALGCGFLLDWILWLRMSGDGRYFIPMACVAAVLVVCLVFRLFAARPKVRNYLLGAILGVQVAQLWMGAAYRIHVPWDGGPWLEVSVPKSLTQTPSLYFLYGDLSNSFLAAFLPAGSGFVNIGGVYALRARGANGQRIRTLIDRYEPHLEVVMLGTRKDATAAADIPHVVWVNDELGRFGLRADLRDCSTIAVKDTVPVTAPYSMYLLSCQVMPDPAARAALGNEEQAAALIFDRLEDDCPALFHPRRPATRNFSTDGVHLWARQYPGTGLSVYVGTGRRVVVSDFVRGGPPMDLGSEREWLATPPRLECGRRNERYYVKVLAVLQSRSH